MGDCSRRSGSVREVQQKPIRLIGHGMRVMHIAAPFGLADLFALRLRPNPRRFSANFSHVAAGVPRRWPEVTVEGAILDRCTAAK